MKILINEEEEKLANEVFELAKMLPTEILRDFKTMLATANMLTGDKKGA